jgi:pyruvate formate lyase activating enzyme
MLIGGLQKFSLLDYPGQVAAIVFTQGCNFRCQFCYNPMLVWPDRLAVNQSASGNTEVGKLKNTAQAEKKSHPAIKEGDFFDFLKNRVGKLDAVVISGGEPTLQADLPEFLSKIKKLGFKIKLDTNGTSPAMIKKLIKNKLLDYIAMDIKAGEKKYNEVTGSRAKLSNIKESIKIIRESGLPYEFRSTIVPGLHDGEEIKAMGKLIVNAEKWYLQNLKVDTDLMNAKLQAIKPYTKKEMEEFRKIGNQFVKKCEMR